MVERILLLLLTNEKENGVEWLMNVEHFPHPLSMVKNVNHNHISSLSQICSIVTHT